MPESSRAKKESSISFLVLTAIAFASFGVIPNSVGSNSNTSFRNVPNSLMVWPGPVPRRLLYKVKKKRFGITEDYTDNDLLKRVAGIGSYASLPSSKNWKKVS